MKFLLDMGISVGAVTEIEALGHSAHHLASEGLPQLGDPEILAKARAEGAILLTHDLGFGDLLTASGENLPSVVTFRLQNMRPESVMAALRRVLDRCSPALEAGAVVSVSDRLVRVRSLPLERREGKTDGRVSP